jgi:hypothetical protein
MLLYLCNGYERAYEFIRGRVCAMTIIESKGNILDVTTHIIIIIQDYHTNITKFKILKLKACLNWIMSLHIVLNTYDKKLLNFIFRI